MSEERVCISLLIASRLPFIQRLCWGLGRGIKEHNYGLYGQLASDLQYPTLWQKKEPLRQF